MQNAFSDFKEEIPLNYTQTCKNRIPASGRRTVALYARISRKDRERQGSSRSIAGQLSLLHGQIRQDEELSEMQVIEYQDDGYTGSSQNRPGFRKMLAGIYLGRIHAVVVKDFSRLSRDHIFLAQFREKICVKYHVILLSIGDGYDNRDGRSQELGVGLRGIFYEYYSRDISHKVKQALQARKENGIYAAAIVPFGYRRTGSGNSLEIYEPEAETVRLIYEMALQGKNSVQIAEWMNQTDRGRRWSGAAVWRIMNQPVYSGCFVWHKTESRFCNGFVRESLPKTEWRRQENCFPAIISPEVYEKVQDIQKRTTSFGRQRRHPFHGVSRCLYCGGPLCRHRRNKGSLCCPNCREGAQQQFATDILWRVLRAVFLQEAADNCTNILVILGENGKWLPSGEASGPEIECFLRYFVREIRVGDGRLCIQWRITSPENNRE